MNDDLPKKLDPKVEAHFAAKFCPSCGAETRVAKSEIAIDFGVEKILCRSCGLDFSVSVNAKVQW